MKEGRYVWSLFGKYLEDVGVLTHEQYMEIVEASRTARVKMGLLAVSEGLMTKEQADEVNQLQAMKDARFGDIAVEKGYLTDEQVGKLLKNRVIPIFYSYRHL